MPKSLEEIFNAPQGKKSLEEIFSSQGAAPIEQSAPQQDKKSVGGFVGNVFSSGAKLIGNTVSGLANVFNPNPEKNTIANVARLGAGVVEKIIPGTQSHEKYANAVGSYYKDRYGGAQNIADTAYNDPVGLASDASVLLGGGAALLKGAGAISKSSAFTKAGQVASKASSVIDPIQMGAKAFSKPVSVVAASRPAQATAERLANF